MTTIPGITGNQYQKPVGYDIAAYQYATSTHADRTKPHMLIQPQSKHEIAHVLRYARLQGIAVAIRSGGHQYSGASSTSGPNIQLDLRETFKTDDDLIFFEKDNKAFVKASVSWTLLEFNTFLAKHNAFVPHGQCAYVCLGGHVQTGGYGQLGRSFGLLGDHVISMDVVNYEGYTKEVSKDTDQELFYAILGGSPGNLGVLTHVTLEVHLDKDYLGCRGLEVVYAYTKKTLKYLMRILVDMSDNKAMKRNYDLCISVVSETYKLRDVKSNHHDKDAVRTEGKQNAGPAPAPSIIVWAQWVPFGSEDDKPDVVDAWFESLRPERVKEKVDDVKVFLTEPEEGITTSWPMSKLGSLWIFYSEREFLGPYEKRTYLTNSTTLKDGDYKWSDWLTDRIDPILLDPDNGIYLSTQIQPFGGDNSKFITNAKDGATSYSWRTDTTMVLTFDYFYDPDPPKPLTAASLKDKVETLQKDNDNMQIGPQGLFSKEDRRALWGSFGEYDLHKVRNLYYEDEDKYKRLAKARRVADPNGIFTPNTFCVRRAD